VANITLTIPDRVYAAARIKAAQSQTSVSALVRDYLVGLTVPDKEFQRLLALQEEILNQIHARGGGIAASERLTRDEVHDRNALR
jgi:plasmid stability protein